MSLAIEVRDLTKYYSDFLAVDHISFDVEMGEIFGFLGPNGAGKSTTIRMLTGISLPSAGTAKILGYDIVRNPVEAQALMGIVPDISNIYTALTAWQNLDFTGKLYGIARDKREEKNRELLERFELYDRKDDKVEDFSRGMRRKVCIAMALVNDSKVLYLDEPTSGLDVQSVRSIRDLVRDLNDEGLTVFLTTHNMGEANTMCDRIAVINRGKIAAIDTPEKLKGAMRRSQVIELSIDEEELNLSQIADMNGVIDVQKRGDKYRIRTGSPKETLRALCGLIEKEDLDVVSLSTLGSSLEDAFMELTGMEMKKEIIAGKGRRKR
ncbi:ATP-binding cassette domain-containing protein [Candidatus Bathyarchaeota archaeon]|nr:ATP-binding cassette domain-containing protein [Candidatus Bathyarchaeota archaeon]